MAKLVDPLRAHCAPLEYIELLLKGHVSVQANDAAMLQLACAYDHSSMLKTKLRDQKEADGEPAGDEGLSEDEYDSLNSDLVDWLSSPGSRIWLANLDSPIDHLNALIDLAEAAFLEADAFTFTAAHAALRRILL